MVPLHRSVTKVNARLLFTMLAALAWSISSGQINSTLSWQGVQRSYITYLPGNYPSGGPYPLIVACHPGLSNGTQHAAASGWHLVGDTAGFITVYPNAMPPGSNPSAGLWNAYDQPSSVAQYDDVGFLLRLMDTLAAMHPIDTCRIYFSGFSSGAMMNFRMACDAADRIAAIAPVSGGWGYGADGSCDDGQCNGDPAGTCGWNMAYVDCAPQRAMPVAFMKGSLEGDNFPTCRATTDSLQREFWPAFLDCAMPVVDTVQRAGKTIVRERWDDCVPGSAYHFYNVLGNSHQWHTPATVMQWEFLKDRSLCALSTGLDASVPATSLIVKPNPFSDHFTIASATPDARVIVQDIHGRTVFEGPSIRIDARGWAPGLYLVRVLQEGQARSVRVIKE
jgi:poly(3-hydroxybutyrate) depolymerase